MSPDREPDFSRGLLTAVVQDARTREVLMVAHMDRDAYAASLATRRATFWSRSRQRLWEKGETSGNTLRVVEARLDCDGDSVLLLVEPAGPACHTGATSCFAEPPPDAAPVEGDGER
ncbi:MAG: phosphoribosyl-AMP cyclohydrolase [Candidatus Dormibacteria bacterium]